MDSGIYYFHVSVKKYSENETVNNEILIMNVHNAIINAREAIEHQPVYNQNGKINIQASINEVTVSVIISMNANNYYCYHGGKIVNSRR